MGRTVLFLDIDEVSKLGFITLGIAEPRAMLHRLYGISDLLICGLNAYSNVMEAQATTMGANRLAEPFFKG